MRNKLFYAYLPLVVLFILGGCKDDKEADLTPEPPIPFIILVPLM